MRTVGFLALALLVAAAAPRALPQNTGALKVTVDYRGPGTVDATHEVIVWLFDTPDINVDSIPIAQDAATSNGATLSFTGLPSQVYMAAVFDEKGDYDGTSGPPPQGTPVVIYGDGGVAKAVPTGSESLVTLTFDDSMRMP